MNGSRFVFLFFSLFAFSFVLRGAEFSGDFRNLHDRVWAGADYWANPMEDWEVQEGRLVCIRSGVNRNVHLLTYGLAEKPETGAFTVSVRMGLVEGSSKNGSAGFLVGVLDAETRDPQASLLRGDGLKAGVTADGRLFVGKNFAKEKLPEVKDVTLRLEAHPHKRKGHHGLQLVALKGDTDEELGRLSGQVAKSESLVGNVALGCNLLEVAQGRGKGGAKNLSRFWFNDWKLSGEKVKKRPDLAFGPILYAMHSLSRGVLKLTAQMPPHGEKEAKVVRLKTQDEGGTVWKTRSTVPIDPLSRTATFEVKGWDDARDIPYRLVYEERFRDGSTRDAFFTGTIRKDPKDKESISVAGFTGNQDTAFPNATLVRNVSVTNPDVLFFSGDQLYEGVGGYGIHREPVDLAVLNYLRKIYLWGWAFRDLMRDRPTLALPDDHDVYQGNIWGESGRDCGGIRGHAKGGYAMHPEFVRAVERTQTAHHPAPFDPTPVERGIGTYYGDFVYGRVGLAVIEDRKFKSGPEGKVNTWPGRPDHVKDASIDVAALDKPGLVLLGQRQLKFLRHFAGDWKGQDLKMAVSQTIFCNLANYHGGNRQYLVADLDSNGWPQSGRNRALAELRRGHVFHYAGDQHLASIVHHGIDAPADAGFSFCVPSIAAGYPRSWRPDDEGLPVRNRPKPGLPNTGDYKDGLGNHVRVYAIGNPAAKNRQGRLNTLHDKASGFGLVRLNKRTGAITMECHRLLIDAADPKPGDQFPGWPKTIDYRQNYGRAPVAHLPEIRVKGIERPVIHLRKAGEKKLIYALRLTGSGFRPPVFDPGSTYDLTVGDPDQNLSRVLKNLKPASKDSAPRTVKF